MSNIFLLYRIILKRIQVFVYHKLKNLYFCISFQASALHTFPVENPVNQIYPFNQYVNIPLKINNFILMIQFLNNYYMNPKAENIELFKKKIKPV